MLSFLKKVEGKIFPCMERLEAMACDNRRACEEAIDALRRPVKEDDHDRGPAEGIRLA